MAVPIPFRRPAAAIGKLERNPIDVLQELALKSPADLIALAMMAQSILDQLRP